MHMWVSEWGVIVWRQYVYMWVIEGGYCVEVVFVCLGL